MTTHPAAAGAVVIGGYANALNVVRSLAPHAAHIAVVTTEDFDIAQHSRGCDERVDLRGVTDLEAALGALLRERSRGWSGRVVFPTNDASLLALARLRESLPGLRVVAPSPDVAHAILSKDETDAHARAVGIDVPRFWGPADASTCERDDLCFPVVVKPLESHSFAARFGCKLFFARDRAELSAAVARVAEAQTPARILEFVPGGDDAFYNYCVYLDADGEPRAGLGMHKLRKSPPLFGVCRVAEPWPDDGLREPTVELLRRIGYRGMANAEYKRDPRDGRFRLMEVNGRPFLMAGVARRAGVDLVRLAWSEALGAPLPQADFNGWRGHWIHLHADLLYALMFRRVEKLRLRDYLKPYLRSPTFAVWSARDPLPFAAQWTRTVRAGVRMAVDPQRREALRRSVSAAP